MLGSLGRFFGRSATVVGLNAVPVAGFFGAGWSASTALGVYWIESVFVIALVSLRIALHRRWTGKAGHRRAPDFAQRSPTAPRPLGSGTLLGGYLGVALPFTLVHGFFLSLILFLLLPRQFGAEHAVSGADLGRGGAGVVAFLLVGFLIDAVGIRHRSFRWIELLTQRALGRIFVVHLTLVFGLAAMAWYEAPAGLFGVFAGLKTLVDLGGAVPHREAGLEPPRWLRFLERVEGPGGERFSAHWRRDELRAREIREENERVAGAGAARAAPG